MIKYNIIFNHYILYAIFYIYILYYYEKNTGGIFMKLFILKDMCNNIIAISESKHMMTTFCLQIDFDPIRYIVKRITETNKINKYLLKYDDLYLIDYENFVIREKDYKIFNELISFEYERIRSVISSLQEITDHYNISPKEQKTLNESIDILKKKSKKKKINSFIDLNGLIQDYFNNKDFRQYMEEIRLLYEQKNEIPDY